MINIIAEAKLPTHWAEFNIKAYQDDLSGEEHLVLSLGDIKGSPLVRIHSQCLTGDALFSLRCDCGPQLELAIQMIAEEGKGLLIYMAQEGRGIGLGNKIKAYELQDKGLNTVEANERLGFKADQRDYSVCGEILSSLRIFSVKLMTNNPLKVEGLEKVGVKVDSRIPLSISPTVHNKDYLSVKANSMGHFLKKEN
tara:strand:- start:128 stop:715 length:588 start_codon:yes stop_codon:yes gene_type:complete